MTDILSGIRFAPNPSGMRIPVLSNFVTELWRRDPSWYCSAIFLIGRAEFLFQCAFLEQNHIQMAEQQPSYRKQQNCQRLKIESKTHEENRLSDVNRVANISIRTDRHQVCGGSQRRGRSSSPESERHNAYRHHKCSQ